MHMLSEFTNLLTTTFDNSSTITILGSCIIFRCVNLFFLLLAHRLWSDFYQGTSLLYPFLILSFAQGVKTDRRPKSTGVFQDEELLFSHKLQKDNDPDVDLFAGTKKTRVSSH